RSDRLQYAVRPARVAGQVVGEAAAPAGAVAEILFDRFGLVAEDDVEFADALSGQVLDHVLQERPVHERQQRVGVAVDHRLPAVPGTGRDENGTHGNILESSYAVTAPFLSPPPLVGEG